MSKFKKEAASYGYTRKVTVAIVDTGINTSNRMFKGRTISAQSYNFFNGNKNVTDVFGHGTHVSGIIVDATPANVSLLVLQMWIRDRLMMRMMIFNNFMSNCSKK